MRKKRTSTFKLHSIPIISKDKLRYISYSIPLASIVALLLVLGMAVNPSSLDVSKSYALEAGEWGKSEEGGEESTNNKGDNTEAGVSPLADEGRASIGIGGAGVNDVVAAAPGTTAYRSHDITIDVSKAKAYTLTISGPANLKAPAGTEIPITGAGNKLGSGMADYTWGYSWGTTEADVDNTENAARTYASVSPTGTDLTVPALSDNAVNFSRKLVFAAKFGQLAVAGNYTAPVTLSLAVTPSETGNFWYNPSGGQTVYDAGSTSMQGISSGFCKNNSNVGTGWTVKLRDTRETNKSYTIVKLKDGQCWMQENLSLPGNTNTANASGNALTTADTDNPANGSWTLPTTAWTSTNAEGKVMVGSTSLNGWKAGYGNYYNWFAATAGTGTISVTSGEASGSICPRNWRLPSGNTTGDFQKLFGANGADLGGNNAAKLTAVQAVPYKFSAAGYYTGSLSGPGSDGNYWSSTPEGSSNAYYLLFNSGGFHPANTYPRSIGFSVRCVARY